MNPFYIQRDGSPPPLDTIVLRVGDNLFTGEDDFAAAFTEPSSLESDLLLIGSSIFAADRAYLRGEREDISRDVVVSIPIVNYARLAPLIPLIENTLYHLASEAWTITFRQQPGSPEGYFPARQIQGKTLLFSGGLDSFAAAIEFGTEPLALQLVSHRTKNRIVGDSQNALYSTLRERGRGNPFHRCFISSRSGGPSNLIHDAENSQRTRSFLFLLLAAIMARRSGHKEILYIAENGQMAIHLPLTHGRIGAFSTHTAHPDVLAGMQEFLQRAMDVDFRIENPYVHRTKSEVVRIIHNFAPESIPLTTSCWRSARLPVGVTHCGECVPCLVRRIAIEFITEDRTTYGRDSFRENVGSLPPDDEARRNLFDLAELAKRFECDDDETIVSEWPELYSDKIDSGAVINMYRRFSHEARVVLGRYPMLGPLLE